MNSGNAIATIAGTSSASGSITSSFATSIYLSYPCGVAYDSRSEYQGILIADTSYNRVLKLVNGPSVAPTPTPTKLPSKIPSYSPSTTKPSYAPTFVPSNVPFI